MFAGTLALLTRSLRVDMRLLRTHLFRVGFAGFICLLLLWSHSMSMIFGAPGLQFFRSMAYLNFFLITLAGVGFFATAITEEKEEATLGLLKMAGISRLGILLGKSTSRLISAMLLLLVQLPFTLLAITLGGVTLNQVVAAYLGLLAYMAFLANLALVCSVGCRQSRSAATLTGLLLVAFWIIPSFGKSLLANSASGNTGNQTAVALFDRISDANVFNRLSVIMTTGFAESLFSFQVISNLMAAFLLFVLSWVMFDLFTREQAASAPSRGFVLRPTGRLRFLGTSRTWRNALMWKDFYFITGGRTAFITKSVLYGLIVVAVAVFTLSNALIPRWELIGGSICGTMLAAIAIELCIYSSRIFHDEIKWKTFPAIALLPISTAGIAYSKTAGCLLALVPASIYFLLGAACIPWDFLQAAVSPSTWLGIVTFAIFCHLTSALSLYVKWGALPLALAIMFIMFFFGSCCFPFGLMIAGFGSEAGWGTPFALFAILIYGVVILVPLQLLIGNRLRTVASR